MTRVSIVIPCFNHARFLPEAVEGALAQAWTPVEVVVVDDGSTDDTAGVASRYPVRLVRQPNRGLSAARNAGLRASAGDVVIFADADDRLRPSAAAAAVRAFESAPGAMLAFGRCALIDESGTPMRTDLPQVTGPFYLELLRRNYIWTPAAAAFRREVFDAVGPFDPLVNPAADYDMYLRIAREFPLAAHDDIVADYRQYPTSMSRDPVLMLDTTLTVLRRQRRHARRSAEARRAYRAGDRGWREFYGERLVEQFRAAIRRPAASRDAVRLAYHLLRLYPRGVAHHVAKKARLLYAGRAVPAAEIAAATSRASDSPGSR